MSQKLAERTLKSLAREVPEKVSFLWDSDVTGFGAKITPAGRVTFVAQARTVEGRSRRLTIGPWPRWSVEAARAEAREILRRFDQGEDPAREKRKAREAPTVADLCDRFMEHSERVNRPQTVMQYRQMVDRHIRPALGSMKVHSVEASDVEALHAKMRSIPGAANRTLAALSRMFNLARRWRWTDTDNPVKGVERYPESERERFLSVAEIRRLLEVLDEWPFIRVTTGKGKKRAERKAEKPDPRKLQSCDAIRLLLFTGARVSETLAAEWPQFDLESGVWTKPAANTKFARKHRVPLSAPALAVLIDLRARREKGARWLFPDPAGEGPQRSLKTTWRTLRQRAGIPDVRLHDLRHSYASLAAAAGVPLETLGKLLGHTKTQTTRRYAHLWDDPLREATDSVAKLIAGGEGREDA